MIKAKQAGKLSEGELLKKADRFTKSNYNHFFIISGKHQESLNS